MAATPATENVSAEEPIRGAKGSVRLDDGRWQHTYSQSWLNDVELCDERGRLDWVGEMPRVESDAASLGTAVHAGAEQVLRDWLAYDSPATLEDAIQVAHLQLSELEAMPNWQWKKYDEETIRPLLETHVTNWYQQILPKLSAPKFIEWPFTRTFYEDDERVIVLAGTSDYIDIDDRMYDWKTSSRPYQPKSKQANAIQPTAYCWAYHEEFGTPYPMSFTYGVMIHPNSKTGKGAEARVQEVEVLRHGRHVDWLRTKVLALAHLVEAELPAWAMKDDGWWCSKTWCPAWNKCKGQFLADM